MKSVITSGMKFGVLLQLAIGPMCLMTFNTAMSDGFGRGMIVVAGIAVVDILYMILAGLGVSKLMKSEKIQKGMKLFGCIVLVLFGLNIIMAVFGATLLPGISIFSASEGDNLFLKCIFLTASNPLTIIFFSGIFSTQVAENKYNSKELFYFGVGVMISTLIFLTGVSLLGTVLSSFIPETAVKIMNFAVGVFLIYFGLKLFLSKEVKSDGV